MNKYFLPFFLLILNLSFQAQRTVTIHQIGKQSDTLFVGNYDDSTLVRINDSTFKFTSFLSQPDRVMFMIDRKSRWWTTIWVEPNVKSKELIIDYNKKTSVILNPTEWDRVTKETGDLEDLQKNKEELIVISNYIDKNPDSYLSLWFFTHSHTLYNEKGVEVIN